MSLNNDFRKLPDGDYLSSVELRYNDAFFLRVLLDDFIEHISEQRLCEGAETQLLERAESCKNTVTEYLNNAYDYIKGADNL